jgi:hypothetical protein
MNPVTVSANLAAWMMLAATLLSIGFLLWFLVRVVREGKKKTVRYVICYDHAERPAVPILDESTVFDQAGDANQQHSMRFNLTHITAGALRKAPRLRSI